jgi:hypothetical protein
MIIRCLHKNFIQYYYLYYFNVNNPYEKEFEVPNLIRC